MHRINKESILLQSLLATAGITLLAIGIITAIAAWRGPQTANQPVVNNISTTEPEKPAHEPQPEPKPAEKPVQPQAETLPPAEMVLRAS